MRLIRRKPPRQPAGDPEGVAWAAAILAESQRRLEESQPLLDELRELRDSGIPPSRDAKGRFLPRKT